MSKGQIYTLTKTEKTKRETTLGETNHSMVKTFNKGQNVNDRTFI